MPKMLNRKTGRAKTQEEKMMVQDFDLIKFKEEMKKEMSNYTNAKEVNEFNDKQYDECYQYYITDIFNSNILMIINRLCVESKTIPDELRNQFPVHSLVLKISKELMLNQLELVYLSLYFDKFGWRNNQLEVFDYFIIIGLSVKKYLNDKTEVIENYLCGEYPEIIAKYNLWLKQQKEIYSTMTIPPKEVNERFNILIKPYNTFCKNNFIDYNESVDKILQMSLPYNEGAKQGAGDKTELVSFEQDNDNNYNKNNENDNDDNNEEYNDDDNNNNNNNRNVINENIEKGIGKESKGKGRGSKFKVQKEVKQKNHFDIGIGIDEEDDDNKQQDMGTGLLGTLSQNFKTLESLDSITKIPYEGDEGVFQMLNLNHPASSDRSMFYDNRRELDLAKPSDIFPEYKMTSFFDSSTSNNPFNSDALNTLKPPKKDSKSNNEKKSK